MKITTLGTSHGDPTYCRFNTSTLYEIGDFAYLVDSGEPVRALLVRKNFDFSRLRAIFITHMHADHTNGLTTLVDQFIKYQNKNQVVDIFFPDPLAQSAFTAWHNATCGGRYLLPKEHIRFHCYTAGSVYDDGTLRVSAVGTEHIASVEGCSRSYSLILEGEGKRVFHSGDLSCDFHDYPAVTAQLTFDLGICEATHYSQATAKDRFMRSRFSRLLFIHIGNAWHGESGEAKLREQNKDLPYPVEIAHDGDVFEL